MSLFEEEYKGERKMMSSIVEKVPNIVLNGGQAEGRIHWKRCLCYAKLETSYGYKV